MREEKSRAGPRAGASGGHSYGGAVISEAGIDDKVSGLVYIAAFAPDVGESPASLGLTVTPDFAYVVDLATLTITHGRPPCMIECFQHVGDQLQGIARFARNQDFLRSQGLSRFERLPPCGRLTTRFSMPSAITVDSSSVLAFTGATTTFWASLPVSQGLSRGGHFSPPRMPDSSPLLSTVGGTATD